MDNNELAHWGIKGMKWGVRRTPAQLGHDKPKKRVHELSDDELSRKIKRLEMEKRYKDLTRHEGSSRGKKFILDVLEASGKNILTQAVTYVAGVGVNKALGTIFDDPKIVNPKKGQKDK